MDVIPSKELDHGNTSNSTNFEDLGKNSLGDLFSPLRDGMLMLKLNCLFISKNCVYCIRTLAPIDSYG